MRSAVLLPLLAVAAAGCRVSTIEPVPIAGPTPRSIAVWPLVTDPTGAPVGGLLEDLDRAARSRGYDVLATAVTYRMLVDEAAPGATPDLRDLPALGRQLGVEAILVLDVRAFAADGEPPRSARWDLGWRLLSTAGRGELWSWEHHGSWRRRPADDDEPLRPPDDAMRPVTLGGDRSPYYRSLRELAADLHRHAMDHLPRCTR